MGAHILGAKPWSQMCPGESMDSYRERTGLNFSTLKAGLLDGKASPVHLHAALEGEMEKEATKSLGLGRATHVRFLEPQKYKYEVKVTEVCRARQANGQFCEHPGKYIAADSEGGWVCGKHAKQIRVLTPEWAITAQDGEKVEKMYHNVCQDEVVAYLRAQGGVETSFYWSESGWQDDKPTVFKGRVDKHIAQPVDSDHPPAILDIKTIQGKHHTEWAFRNQIKRYDYDLQAYMYCRGMAACDGIDRVFLWIVVETEPPFDVASYWASDPMLKSGEEKFLRIMECYRECRRTGQWPSLHRQTMKIYPA